MYTKLPAKPLVDKWPPLWLSKCWRVVSLEPQYPTPFDYLLPSLEYKLDHVCPQWLQVLAYRSTESPSTANIYPKKGDLKRILFSQSVKYGVPVVETWLR